MIETYVKKLKNKIRWNGLNRKQSFILEYNCLKRLNENFKCICTQPSSHFPKIISRKKYRKFVLSYCGKSLNINKTDIIIENMEEQIDCILHNLQISNIKHLDMKSKNLCINDDGIISVIDFDIAVIDNNPLSNKIKKFFKKYSCEDYEKHLKQKIINIIKKNKYITV